MPPDLNELLNVAFTRHNAGDLAEASQLYRDILQHYPLQADALHMLGVIAKQKGDGGALLLRRQVSGQYVLAPGPQAQQRGQRGAKPGRVGAGWLMVSESSLHLDL